MDPRDLERAAREQGWTVSRTKRGHWRFVPPDSNREMVIAAGTPGDRRFLQILLADLRRQGFVWPWPRRGKG